MRRNYHRNRAHRGKRRATDDDDDQDEEGEQKQKNTTTNWTKSTKLNQITDKMGKEIVARIIYASG